MRYPNDITFNTSSIINYQLLTEIIAKIIDKLVYSSDNRF